MYNMVFTSDVGSSLYASAVEYPLFWGIATSRVLIPAVYLVVYFECLLRMERETPACSKEFESGRKDVAAAAGSRCVDL